MTIATRITCDAAEGCDAERAPYSQRGNAGWSHFTVKTYDEFAGGRGNGIAELDLCPVHALAIRERLGAPQ